MAGRWARPGCGPGWAARPAGVRARFVIKGVPADRTRGPGRRPEAPAGPPHQYGRPAPGSQSVQNRHKHPAHPSARSQTRWNHADLAGGVERGILVVPNLDTSSAPPSPPTELVGYIDRTRSSYLPNSIVISTELDRHIYRTRWLFRPNSANVPSNRRSPERLQSNLGAHEESRQGWSLPL